MPWEVWSGVGAVALVDAFNPTALIVLILVLGRPGAFWNGAAYSTGMLGTHLLGGLAVAGALLSLGDLMKDLLREAGTHTAVIESVLGLSLLGMYALMEAHPRRPADDAPPMRVSNTGIIGWVIIGFGVTMTKLVFAPLYVSQVGVIVVNAQGSAFWFWMGLLYYHLIAFFPFFLVWIIWLIWRERSAGLLGDLNERIRTVTPIVMKYGILLVGTVLLADGIARSFGFPFLWS